MTAPPGRLGESRVGVAASWASLIGSFVLSFATWVNLAVLTGFDDRLTITAPIVGTGTVVLYLAWAMPLCVDGYVVGALAAWMSPVSAPEVAAFARWNTYVGAGIGVLAQSSYHATVVWSERRSGWLTFVAAGVGLLPPLLAAAGVHLRALVRRAALAETQARLTQDTRVQVRASGPEPLVPRPGPAGSAPVAASLGPTGSKSVPATPRTAVARRPGVRPVPRRPRYDTAVAMGLLAEGLTPREVAARVGVTKKTIERLRLALASTG